MTGADPRELAAEVLAAVDEGHWSDESLSHALEHSRLSDVDRSLATLLVYGTLARQRTLDHTITALAARPMAKIDTVALLALRLGLFQMAFLDRVPDHAAVMTSVDLVARYAPHAKGFVNALLRRVQREGLAPPPESPLSARLGVEHSHPDWLVDMWIEELGRADAEALLAADNDVAPTCYRAIGARDDVLRVLSQRGIEATAGLHAPGALIIGGPVRDLAGIAVPQGEASQLVVAMLDARPSENVLDACASPGGKTAAIACSVGADGIVVACDPASHARSRISASLAASGIVRGVEIHECTVGGLAAREAGFDAVLVDAPCSGLGTLRQHPEIRWRRTPDDLADLAAKQRRILFSAAGRVRPGGRVVYSTCTIARTENEGVVEGFLASNPDFSLERRETLPDAVASLCDASGALRTFPHRHGIDGFYAVRLRRAV